MGERKLSFKPMDLREADFKRAVNAYVKFPPDMRTEFLEYWSEPDRAANPKMRWEKEKTWDLARRLGRWSRSEFNKSKKTEGAIIHQMHPKKEIEKSGITDIERLDALLVRYADIPTFYTIERLSTNWPTEALNHCYNIIKENKLWDPRITKTDLDGLEERRLKATVIIRTLDYYGCKGWMFSDTLKAREKR